MSTGVHILLKDVVDWVEKDSGLRITEQDIRVTVTLYMQDWLEIANDVIFACSKQYQENGEGRRDTKKAVENSCWKHGMRQNARTAHERPELVVNVIGSAVGVSVNTEVVPNNSPWTINGPIIGMACKQFRRGMQESNGGQPARQEPVAI